MSISRTPLRAVTIAAAFAVGALLGPTPSAAEETRTFTGLYDWSDGGTGELTARFDPDGEDAWSVEFRFRFSNKSYTWKGTASGPLENGGTLSGTAQWSGRDWVFEADLSEGVLAGRHTEIQSGGERYETGTFELSEAP